MMALKLEKVNTKKITFERNSMKPFSAFTGSDTQRVSGIFSKCQKVDLRCRTESAGQDLEFIDS